MQPLISIIVPVYKVEMYIDRCIESLINQTYRNLEIILVDDGSPDKSGEICDLYAQKDNRIKVIHKENGGVSTARNTGILFSKGQYLTFVDSDDQLYLDGIYHLFNAIKSYDCQYVAGVCGINDSNKVKNMISSEEVISYSDNPDKLLEYLVQKGAYSPYAKLFDNNIIKANNLLYDPQLKCSEDALFIRQYLKYCDNICLIPKVIYKYNTDNAESLSKKRYKDFCVYYSKKIEALENLLNKLPLDNKQKETFLAQRIVHGFRISMMHYFLNWNEYNERIELINICVNVFIRWMNLDYKLCDKKTYRWFSPFIKDIISKDVKMINNRYNKFFKKIRIKLYFINMLRKHKRFFSRRKYEGEK